MGKKVYFSLGCIKNLGNYTSEITNTKTFFLCPNTEYVKRLAQGNLGIADGIYRQTINNEIKSSSKLNLQYPTLDIPNILQQNNSRVSDIISIPEKIAVGTCTQEIKPFMQIVGKFDQILIKIEDIGARLSVLSSGRPLTTKSLKPIVNDGTEKSPKALGYKNGEEMINELNVFNKELSNIQTLNLDAKINPNSDVTITKKDNNPSSYHFETISIDYSTGDYVDGIDYTYKYIDIDETPLNMEYDFYSNWEGYDIDVNKDKPIIIGIYDKDGIPFNPKEKLKTYTKEGILESEYEKAEWILKSNKWILPDNQFSWDELSKPKYRFTNKITTKDSFEKPKDTVAPPSFWSIKKYGKKDKNVLSGEDAIEGDPIIVDFAENDLSIYNEYMSKEVAKINVSEDLDDDDKNEIISSMTENIKTMLELATVYGQVKQGYKESYPDELKRSFKMMKFGDNYIDPENEYNLKIIKVVPYTKIPVKDDNNGETFYSKSYSFVKNRIIIKNTTNELFDIQIYKNGFLSESYQNISEYVLDNWNFEISNNIPTTKSNNYQIIINNNIEKSFSNKELPEFGIGKIYYYDTKTLSIDETFAINEIKIISDKYPAGKILDKTHFSNEHLSTDELFSDGYYGGADDEIDQHIETIYRYPRTEFDTEPYYIIEGSLLNYKDGNQQANHNKSSKKWYKFKDALKVFKILISLANELTGGLIKDVNTAIKMFSDPKNAIPTAILNTIGQYYPPLLQISDVYSACVSRISDIKNISSSDIQYKSILQQEINMIISASPISHLIYYDEKTNKIHSLLDGTYEKDFDIFGKTINIGLESSMFDRSKPVIRIWFGKKDKDTAKTLKDFLEDNNMLSNLNNNDLLKTLNKNSVNNGNGFKYEIIDIKYSTGKYIEGVNYQYIYIDLEDEEIINKAQNIIQSNNISTDDINEAKSLLDKLTDLIKKYGFDYLKQLKDMLLDKILDLLKNVSPELYLLVNLIIMPIKMVIQILKEILNFLKDCIKKPRKIPSLVKDFLTFGWIKSIIKPENILKLIGLNLDMDKLSSVLSDADKLSNKDNLKKMLTEFNFSSIISGFFMFPIDNFNFKGIKLTKEAILKWFKSLLCLIEKIINSMIDTIICLLGIEPIIKPPHIKLCSNDLDDMIKKANDLNTLTVDDIIAEDESLDDYIYDITLSDGTKLKNLTEDEMNEYVLNHSNLEFNFAF